jgi:hypothetical protein
LVPLFGDYYIGGDHSRVIFPSPNNPKDRPKSFHFTHLVILDVRHWKVVFVSKPLLYDTNHFADDHYFCIQDPISLNRIDNFTYSIAEDRFIVINNTTGISSGPAPVDATVQHRFLLTSNIADRYSLAYELSVSITEQEVAELATRHVPVGTKCCRYVVVRSGHAVIYFSSV